jgi:transcriptional regulator
MYPPKHHQEYNFSNILKTVAKFPLATLISANGEDCLSSHIPLIYKKDNSGLGKLLGHIDKNNPQCSFLNNRKVFVIFHGPDTYISPNTYTSSQLPTWNYIKVHMEGNSRIIDSPDLIKKSMIEMTGFLEKTEPAFKLEYDDPKMAQLINYVTGFEITITKWEGKYKLSQDKIPSDTKNAREKLILDSRNDLREFIESIS